MAPSALSTSSALPPSPQQSAILTAAANAAPGTGLIINAKAGTGKTSTLFMVMEQLHGSIAMVAYNAAIVAELSERVNRLTPRPNRRIAVKTAHGWGRQALLTARPGLTLSESKGRELASRLKMPEPLIPFAESAYRLARGAGFGLPGTAPVGPVVDARWLDLIEHYGLEEKLLGTGAADMGDEFAAIRETLIAEGVKWAAKLLYWGSRWMSDREDGQYDYEDMVWGPIALSAPVRKHDWILVDECQDLNQSRLALIKSMMGPNSRVVFVGDPCQAINGFAGADSSSFEKIKTQFRVAEYPLTTTYRNTHKIVAYAKSFLLPGERFEAAAGNAEGAEPDHLEYRQFVERLGELRPGVDMVVCRNNAPLVELWFAGLRAGVKMRMKGGQDLGKQLSALANKWKVNTARQLRARLGVWIERQQKAAEKAGKPGLAEKAQNQYDVLMAVIEGLGETATVVDVLDTLDVVLGGDSTSPAVELCTIHRSKGMEREHVWWLGPELLPSPYAKKEWQRDQERFLQFVAATRAKVGLHLVGCRPKKG